MIRLTMKVNLGNTKIMSAGTLIGLIVLIFSFFTTAEGRGNLAGFYLFFLLFSVFYILLLTYLTKILWAFKEDAAIIGAFTIVTCLEVINLIMGMSSLNSNYAMSVGVLTEVMSVYLAIQTFRVKNKEISLPFRLFGVAVFFLSFGKVVLLFALPNVAAKYLLYYEQTVILLTLLSAYYLLKRVYVYIKTTDINLLTPHRSD